MKLTYHGLPTEEISSNTVSVIKRTDQEWYDDLSQGIPGFQLQRGSVIPRMGLQFLL